MASSSGDIVVVAIDGSPFARQALLWYLEHFHRPENKVIMVHTIELPSMPSRDTWESQEKAGKQKAKELFNTFKPILEKFKVNPEFLTHFEKPGEYICQVAKERHAQVIVTGTRGLGKLRKTLLGSVSDYVLRHSVCPVLVCRTDSDFKEKPTQAAEIAGKKEHK